MKIVVNTPAGNIGRSAVDQLLLAKEDVTIISRHPRKVTDLIERGAKLEEGSIDDPGVLTRAFRGADALFWLTPFAADQPDYINTTVSGAPRQDRHLFRDRLPHRALDARESVPARLRLSRLAVQKLASRVQRSRNAGHGLRTGKRWTAAA